VGALEIVVGDPDSELGAGVVEIEEHSAHTREGIATDGFNNKQTPAVAGPAGGYPRQGTRY
jgi:hypothetical protein